MPLRPFSARMFPDTVTIYAVTHSSGDHGGDPATPDGGTTMSARVLEVTRPERMAGQDQVFGVNRFEVTTRTDPGVDTDDRIDWHGRHLAVEAPAVDMGGEGRRWRTYCRETS